MSHDFWIHLKPEIAAEWTSLIGDSGRLPVKTPIPQYANLPGFGTPQRVFFLALDVLEAGVLERIARRLAGKFGLDEGEALDEIRKAGIPIREEHVSGVITHNPQRWF